jgi:TM2 domain-containing membrane protein YozV
MCLEARTMAEFSVVEQMQLCEGMTDQQKFLFQSQYAAARKDRVVLLVISIFLGGLGIDRFLVGDIGLGLLKLLTGGICGLFWIVDWFLIMGRVDDLNRRKAGEIAMAIKMSGAGM